MNGRGRQFSRGAIGAVNEPPRRRRFQYVRRRTPSGGYRAGSFSDDRNDSSPPLPSTAADDLGYEAPAYLMQPQRQQQRMQRTNPRGNRHYNQRHQHQQQSQDRNYYETNYQQQRLPISNTRNTYEASDNEYNDHNEQPSSRENANMAVSTRKVDELCRSFQDQKTDIDQMRQMFSKLTTELDQVKTRVRELESTGPSKSQQQPALKEGAELDEKEKRRKFKALKQREKKTAKLAEKKAAISESASHKILNSEQASVSDTAKPQDSTSNQNAETTSEQPEAPPTRFNRRVNRERNIDKRRVRREPNKASRPFPKESLVSNANDDSTTQAAEPSSEDRPEGDDGRDDAVKERVRVFRRKKQHFAKRGPYGNRRRRADSSERNSNDTSPQGDANGNDDYHREKRKRNKKKVFPELSDDKMNEIVQDLTREFLNHDINSPPTKIIKKEMNSKGPKVAYEFAKSILDHTICDVTSPTKRSEIASNLYLLLVSEDNTSEVDFQQGFYDAVKDISNREDDIAIDAPRYMDTLGLLLGDCIVLMINKHRYLVKKFLRKCTSSYGHKNRGTLLVSIMKTLASVKNERFAKDVLDLADLDWGFILSKGTDLNEFLATHEAEFMIRTFSPEPPKPKKGPKEMEKFADDVTALVETHCDPQTLDHLVKELDLEHDERVDYMGTLIYAIVRGCLTMDSGDYKLNHEALNKYSSILTAKIKEPDAVALRALTALTRLWESYNCPQDLLRTILVALHNHGTASYEALKTWLNSDDLNNIPGIGAARLSSKRCIEDLGAKLE